MTSSKMKWVALIAVAIIATVVALNIFSPSTLPKVSGVDGVTNYNKLGVTEIKAGSSCNDGFTYAGCTGAYITGLLATVGTFTQGGGLFATTSTGASTLDISSIASANLIQRSGVALTLTLPASSTMTSFVPTVGQTRTIFIANIGTGAVTLAGGSGTLLQSASTTAIGIGGTGRIDFIRKSNTDVIALFSHGI